MISYFWYCRWTGTVGGGTVGGGIVGKGGDTLGDRDDVGGGTVGKGNVGGTWS